ncbi:MAG: DHH family phosphoesterase [Candidatus Thorarchaeota archaeon]
MNLLDTLKGKNDILVLGHHNADPDAVCSMIAFSELYHSINPDGKATLACDDVSRLAKQVLENMASNVEILEDIDTEFDFVVVLDTNSALQLGSKFERYVSNPSKVFVIDHHEHNPDLADFAAQAIVMSDRSSTCEVLTDLHQQSNIPISPHSANLLLTGMIFDTRRFVYADKRTLEIAINLIDAGADYNACVRSLVIRPDRSERIARLKAAGRLEVHTIDEWVVVTAKIGAYEASACRGLIDLGADAAIVGGKPSKEKVRISARSTQEFSKKTGVNLGTDVMEQLGELIDGKGGGHPNAAGANGKRNRKKALLRSVELIRETIGRNQGESHPE